MWSLKNKSIIEHNVFAIYVSNFGSSAEQSSIKFGSYDQNGVKEGEKFETLPTIDKTTWGINLSTVNMSDEAIVAVSDYRELYFEPMMTYAYIPTVDFNLLTDKLEKIFPDINCTFGVCNFDKSCKEAGVDPPV